MIFPYLNGIINLKMAPMTWVLVALQILFFISFSPQKSQKSTREISRAFLETQGDIYGNYILNNSTAYDLKTIELAKKANVLSQTNDLLSLGHAALQDVNFNSDVEKPLFLDAVIFSWWQKKYLNFKETQSQHPHYILGVGSNRVDIGQWLTYQFVHSDSMHLISNMIFLILFGAALEAMLGGLAMLVTFISGGLFAAGIFLLFEGASAIPLIGASGSVSAVIGLFCALNWRQGIRYLFFLFIPKPGYAGFVYLPGWLAFMSYLAADAAGWLSSGTQFGSVAHSAHIGGQMMGLLVAFIFVFTRKYVVQKQWPEVPKGLTAKPFSVIS